MLLFFLVDLVICILNHFFTISRRKRRKRGLREEEKKEKKMGNRIYASCIPVIFFQFSSMAIFSSCDSSWYNEERKGQRPRRERERGELKERE